MLRKTSLLILLAAPSCALKHVFGLALTIKEAEVEKCITCVSFGDDAGGRFTFSWLDGSCSSDRDCGERSDRCCSDVGCCTEDGCRDPNDSFSMGAIADVSSTTATAKSTQSCAQCCDEVVSGTDTDCQIRSWAPDQASTVDETSWYNREAIGDEDTCQTSCPPCAVCSLKKEAEMRGLAAEAQATVFLKIYCTEDICSDLKDVVYKEDPCIMTPDSCSCFCYKANNLLDSCPHLGNVLYPPADDLKDTAQTQAGSSGATRIASRAMYPLIVVIQILFSFLA